MTAILITPRNANITEIVIASVAKQSRSMYTNTGLLRYARNDDGFHNNRSLNYYWHGIEHDRR